MALANRTYQHGMADFKIKPAKLSDRIVEQLENMLLEGSFAPGQKLPPERDLALMFAVSRPSRLSGP